MIPYKELSGLFFVENVTFKKAKSVYSTSRESMAVYSAHTVYTKKGICVLVVCLYKASEQENNWTICERHFLTQNGEMAGEEYLGDGQFRRGDFKIGNSDYTFSNWYDTLSRNLLSRYSTAYVFPYKEADKEISTFVKRYDAFSGYDAHDADFEPKNMLSWLAQYQDDVITRKQNEAETRRRERIQNLMSPYSDPPEEMKKWVFNERLTLAPWFYRYSHNRVQHGKCAGCNQESELDGVKDMINSVCPMCGAEVQCINISSQRFKYNGSKISWKNGKRIAFQQVIKPKEFISRYFYAETIYTYHFNSEEIQRVNQMNEYRRDFWKVVNDIAAVESVYEKTDRWTKTRNRYASFYNLGESWPGNLTELIHATGISEIRNMDIAPLCVKWDRHILELINGLKRNPIVENLGKEGLHRLAERVVYGYGAAEGLGVCDSRKPYKFLGVSKSILPFFAQIDVSVEQVKLWRQLELSERDIEAFCKLCRVCKERLDSVRNIMQKYRLPIGRLSGYLEKQSIKLKRKTGIDMFWTDYVSAAEKLGIGLADNRDLFFPPDIKKEHDRCNDLLFIKNTAKKNQELQQRVEILEQLSFRDKRFIIRPLRSIKEFINESTELDHCVKTYIDKCIAGKANIFALRKAGEPDKPFFTVNIGCNGNLIENRGIHNCSPSSDVNSFVAKWLKVVNKRIAKNPIEPPKKETDTQRVRIGA